MMIAHETDYGYLPMKQIIGISMWIICISEMMSLPMKQIMGTYISMCIMFQKC